MKKLRGKTFCERLVQKVFNMRNDTLLCWEEIERGLKILRGPGAEALSVAYATYRIGRETWGYSDSEALIVAKQEFREVLENYQNHMEFYKNKKGDSEKIVPAVRYTLGSRPGILQEGEIIPYSNMDRKKLRRYRTK